MNWRRVPFPAGLHNRKTGEEVPLVIQAACPSCGLVLDDVNALEGPLRVGGWFAGSTNVRCECGHKYSVNIKLEDSNSA